LLPVLWGVMGMAWSMPKPPGQPIENQAVAVFAGGCFWCMEQPFDVLEGVISTVSGYTGGNKANPTYKQVVSGVTGHYEAVRITYDASIISYAELLQVFWKNIDPFDDKGQFCDKGSQYLSAIFYQSDTQRLAAQQSLENLENSRLYDESVATLILPAQTFYTAEDYHQDFYLKNPTRYKYYRGGCRRDKRLRALWGVK